MGALNSLDGVAEGGGTVNATMADWEMVILTTRAIGTRVYFEMLAVVNALG